MINTDKMHIASLTLLAACDCNLTCKYCSLANSKNSNLTELMKNNVAALEDGTYITNILKIMERLNQDPNQITDLQIWGGEPTLVIGHLADHWGEWIHHFPRIKNIMYSTNGMTHVEDVLKFIKANELYNNYETDITLQISYDGEFGEEHVRGGKCETIEKNYLWLVKELNNTDLEKVSINFQGHGVLSFDLLEQLNSSEAIHNYLCSIDNFLEKMRKACHNRKVFVLGESIQWQTGHQNSTWDGLELAKVMEALELESKRCNHTMYEQSPGAKQQLLGGAWKTMLELFNASKAKTFDEYFYQLLDDKDQQNMFNGVLHCSAILYDLKVMYDGTALMCQNDLFRTQDLDNYYSNADLIHKSRLKRNHMINFLTDTDEEINKFLYFIRNARFEGFMTTFHGICNMMTILAQAGQISPTYLTNLDRLAKHALLIMILDSCYHNTYGDTGSVFIRSYSIIRLFANGILDDMEKTLIKREEEISDQCNYR